MYKQRVKLTKEEQYAKAIALLESTDQEVMESIEFKMASHLKQYEKNLYYLAKSNDGTMIQTLTNKKTEGLKLLIEKMVAINNGFKYEGIIPFENVCTDCSGFGVRLKFFRKKMKIVECKKCDKDPVTGKANGLRSQPCQTCKGTKIYKNPDGEKEPCPFCKGTGVTTFKCYACRGEKEFHIAPLDSKIKSTTPCKTCNGYGFIPTEPIIINKPIIHKRANSKSETLTQNLGIILKAAFSDPPDK